jgi:2-polyprenyl-3-methyl-5-hydroxy-6-metoxy-1,4-benzoquinol methylase
MHGGVTRCPLCGGSNSSLAWAKANVRYVRCASCTLVFQYPPPARGQIEQLYTEGYFVKSSREDEFVGYQDYDQSNNEILAHKLFAQIRNLGSTDRTAYLDIGCATGNLLELARSQGWNATGLEISSWAAAKARSRGFFVYERPVDECHIDSDTFDVVSLFDVIEHFPDPVPTLRTIHRILKPGGRLFVQTPNVAGVDVKYIHRIDSIVLQPDAHLVLFTKRTLRTALEQAGFVVYSMGYIPKFGFFTTYARRLIKRALHRFHYQIFGISIRRYFSEPDHVELPPFTFNDTIQVTAGKAK